ncbi:MAG: efflux RND transporter periplasmic adaptor subunit [Bacillota bacterium]
MKRVQRWALLPILTLILAGCSLGAAGEGEPTIEPIAVAVTEARAGKITATSQSSGQLEPILSIPVTAKVPGRVVAVHKQMGDPVEEGELLVELEVRDAANQYAAAQAQLAQAEAQLVEVQRQADRLEVLLKQGAISRQQAEQIQTQLALAKAQVQAARAQLDLAGANLERTRITAPAKGVLASRSVEPGALVGAGTPLFQLVDLSQVVVNTGVAEAEVNAVRPGIQVPVQVPALGQSFTGMVESVSPYMDQKSRSFKVRVLLQNPDGLLKGGMFAEVKFPIQEQEGVLLPVAAIVERSDEPFVYVIADGRAKQTFVKVTVRANDQVAVEGIEPGTQVVVMGQNRLFDGAPVKVGGGASQ